MAGISKPDISGRSVGANTGAAGGGTLNEQQVPAINAASTSVEAINKARADGYPKNWTRTMARNDVR